MDDPSQLRNQARSLRAQADAERAEAANLKMQASAKESEAAQMTDFFERNRLQGKAHELTSQAELHERQATTAARDADDLDMHAARRGMELEGEAADQDRLADREAQSGNRVAADAAAREAQELRRRASGY